MIANPGYHIELENLTVGYFFKGNKPIEILQNVNFSATPGEMVALIGSNGIGKSTLLRSLTGFQPYLSGNIKINGTELKKHNVKEISKLMSFVSTESIRVPNMTVFDLVSFGRFPYTNWIGKLTQEDKYIVSDAIHKVGLAGFENKMLTYISDGEKQRAMIARAVAQDTPVIILDEPSAFLDVSNKYEIFHLIQMLAREKKKTIILSTHDLNIAMREVDKLWILTKDKNFEGSPEDAALNGWLDLLFTNPHIGFDMDEGEYYFKKEFRQKVKVDGEGLPLIWTLRALNRRGYQIVMKAEPDFHLLADPGLWTLKSKNGDKTFKSIYDVLTELDK